jgi:putative addiction module component (TIGR02574 family)
MVSYNLGSITASPNIMSTELAELKRKAAQLREDERAELALALISSLDGEPETGVDEAWRLEIARRIAQIDRGEVQLVPGDDVFARLRRKLG